MGFEDILNNTNGDGIQQYQAEINAAHEAEFYKNDDEAALKIYTELSEKTGNKELKDLFLKKVDSIKEERKREKEKKGRKNKITENSNPFYKVDGPIFKQCTLIASDKCPRKKEEIDERCIDCSQHKSKIVTDNNRAPEQHLPGERLPGGVG